MGKGRPQTKTKLTAWEWFGQAEQFELAAMMLLDLPEVDRERMPSPLVILRAFAVEAYFKSLLTLAKKDFPRQHNLHLLFTKMRQRDQRDLSKLWKIEYGKKFSELRKLKDLPFNIPVSFKGVVEQSGDAFTLFRYIPEDGANAAFFLMNFPRFIRSYVFKRLLFEDPQPQYLKAEKDGRVLVLSGAEILNSEAAMRRSDVPFTEPNRTL